MGVGVGADVGVGVLSGAVVGVSVASTVGVGVDSTFVPLLLQAEKAHKTASKTARTEMNLRKFDLVFFIITLLYISIILQRS